MLEFGLYSMHYIRIQQRTYHIYKMPQRLRIDKLKLTSLKKKKKTFLRGAFKIVVLPLILIIRSKIKKNIKTNVIINRCNFLNIFTIISL